MAPIAPHRSNALFDLAVSGAVLADGLTDTEVVELTAICAVLDAIDTAWQADVRTRRRVDVLFRTKLAVQRSNHPWLRAADR